MILKFRNTQRRTEERHLCTVHAAFSSFSGGGQGHVSTVTHIYVVKDNLWPLSIRTGWTRHEHHYWMRHKYDTTSLLFTAGQKQNVNLTKSSPSYKKGEVFGGRVHTKYSPASYEFQSKHVSHSVKVVMTLSRRKNWTTQNSKKRKFAEEKQQKKQKSFPPCWSLHKNTCRMQIGCTIHLKQSCFWHEASSL